MEPVDKALLRAWACNNEYPLGNSGIDVSPMGWGMWRFAGASRAVARARVDAALESGYTLFDTADVYGFDGVDGFGAAEELLGELLRSDPSLRSRMVLASKAGVRPPTPYDSSAACLIGACEASLRRLGTDHLDLFFIHRPDLLAHPQEMAQALERLRTAGKIRAAGVSNFSASQTAALMAHLPFALASIQIELSPLVVTALVRRRHRPGDAGGDRRARLVAAGAGAPDAHRWSGRRSAARRRRVALDSDRDPACGVARAGGLCMDTTPSVQAHSAGRIAGPRAHSRGRAPHVDLRTSREEWYRVLEAALGHRDALRSCRAGAAGPASSCIQLNTDSAGLVFELTVRGFSAFLSDRLAGFLEGGIMKTNSIAAVVFGGAGTLVLASVARRAGSHVQQGRRRGFAAGGRRHRLARHHQRQQQPDARDGGADGRADAAPAHHGQRRA